MPLYGDAMTSGLGQPTVRLEYLDELTQKSPRGSVKVGLIVFGALMHPLASFQRFAHRAEWNGVAMVVISSNNP